MRGPGTGPEEDSPSGVDLPSRIVPPSRRSESPSGLAVRPSAVAASESSSGDDGSLFEGSELHEAETKASEATAHERIANRVVMSVSSG